MILRRLTKHVKDQNWFAVGLDFLIVVVGILIAFQITSWNEARQDNLIYEQARTRVIEEANVNLTLAQDFILRALDYQSAARDIIQVFETCNSEAGAEDRLMIALQSLRFILALDVRNDAINLILTSDAFLDNILPQDRATLSVYARKIDSAAENLRFSASFQINRGVLQDNPIFTRTIDVNWGDGLVGAALNVSYEEACKDSVLGVFLFDRFEHSTYDMLQAERLADASRQVLIGLGESPPEKPRLEDAQ